MRDKNYSKTMSFLKLIFKMYILPQSGIEHMVRFFCKYWLQYMTEIL